MCWRVSLLSLTYTFAHSHTHSLLHSFIHSVILFLYHGRLLVPYIFFYHPSCSEQLRRHYHLGEFWVEVELEHINAFNENLYDVLQKRPNEFHALVCCSLRNA